ncbi:alpha/beta hydrolase [Chryseobacterium sp. Ch-15]|uniref:Alpha/beta hydrolase n=1 Tax=Chryseobacterium muglaense TaxID=2893752 RepID=A0A9Q3US93_9FLAO|nr:alpha/beta hydrolase [Chryseobacterium muglaense]MBD3906296.1 alpha/beta hydrolase [Chryseobacterium muglaense]MCC9033063.1 alpha/beta hydrolase [Chryseobacterium muglaense]MCM2555994.1 alpha/beta hydrolase [Chryseobacterium muglaense]
MNKPALEYFGRDHVFPHDIPGLPSKLSDVEGLEIGSFTTNDGVSLSYWKAGKGTPLVFVPGWSSNGAEYINIIHILKDHFEVYVLDQRNHGLSDKLQIENHISRLSSDLNDLLNALKIEKAHLCGWSMGCSVIWGYIDIFGSDKIEKLIFIDEAPSIYCHSDWTQEERTKAGAFALSAERMIALYIEETPVNRLLVDTDIFNFYNIKGAPAFENSHLFAEEFVPPVLDSLKHLLFNHIMNDWRDVIAHKINKPTLVISGEHSNWVESQRLIAETVPDGRSIIYSKDEHGDHFLHLKNPLKFAEQVRTFLNE